MPRSFVTVSRLVSLEDLLRAARAGEAEGIAGLHERFAVALHRTAYRLSGSAADAEDVVHDVFVGLPEALRRYDGQGNFPGWLSRVAVRQTLMRMRGERRRREVSLDYASAVAGRSRTDAATDAAEVQHAVLALPDGLREVLVLRHFEGYAHDEIAALLGITAGASRVRLNRALTTLRVALQTLR